MNKKCIKIIQNNNLIFDLKNDIFFKKIFLDEINIDYLKLLISKVLDIKYNNNLRLANSEIPNDEINKKSSYADIVLKDNNIEYIVEMNSGYSKHLYYKNYHYLFEEHTKRSYNKNDYGKSNYTVLINIDNYDILNKNKLLYKIELEEIKYNTVMYKNIKCLHINLEYLKKKYYNNIKLNELEKLLIVFIERDKNKILNICKDRKVKELINYMEYLQIGNDFITVYDKEEFDRGVREEVESNKKRLEKEKRKLEQEKNTIEQEKNTIAQEKNTIAQEKNTIAQEKNKLEQKENKLEQKENKLKQDKLVLLEEKKEIVKELKKMNLPLNKIIKLTKLTAEQISML